MREPLRLLRRDPVQQPQDAHRALLVLVLAGQRGEPQQPVSGARVARRNRVVLEVLPARDEPLVVRGGLEESAPLLVGEARDHRVRGRARRAEPARVEGGLVEREQRLDEERVVLEVRVQLRRAVPVGAQ